MSRCTDPEVELLTKKVASLEHRLARLEPAPAKTWRDVTSQCEALEQGQGLTHRDSNGCMNVLAATNCPWYGNGYRLRKVQAVYLADVRFGEKFPIDAFIIEKEQP